MQAQNEMITQKKEEAKAATEAAVIADNGDKVNILDIKVEDNFDIDDIWKPKHFYASKLFYFSK